MTSQAAGFFAVDRRAWAMVAGLGLNAAVAYLVLARGSGGDNRTTSWSVNAIENWTGIGRPRAKLALNLLKDNGLVRETRGGTRPSYYIVPAHEVPGCEGYPLPSLTDLEKRAYDQLLRGGTWLPAKGGKEWDYNSPRTLGGDLVRKGWASKEENNHFLPLRYDLEQAAKPDWIWLPNSLIDGVGEEAPPVERLRQSQSPVALRLFVDLYYSHALTSDGGVNWRTGIGVRQAFSREKVGQQGPYTVWGFAPERSNIMAQRSFDVAVYRSCKQG